MPQQDSRAGQLNAVIDPKLLFLAKLKARDDGQTLVEFIEDAFQKALTEPGQDGRLRFESFWHEDEAARLFYVATADIKLVSPKQRALYHHVIEGLIKQRKKVTLKSFVDYFDAQEGND